MTSAEQTERMTLLGLLDGHTYIVEADGSFREASEEERREIEDSERR